MPRGGVRDPIECVLGALRINVFIFSQGRTT
jgi:hypothetical protein